VPIVNKHPIKGNREIPCKVCGNYLDYVYSETIYACSSCGRQYDPRDVLGDIGDLKNLSNKKILKDKPKTSVTRKERVKNSFGDLLDEMANFDPDEFMEDLEEELDTEKQNKK
jgi:hypothetical protein